MFCQVVGSAVSSVYFIQVAQKRYILLVTVFQPALFFNSLHQYVGKLRDYGPHSRNFLEKSLEDFLP